ncbi:MAG: hypothetical protein KAH84_09525 [Thiomargarita sp.]|nr:hypothetical protein [Thiomargarita sp.]
MIWQQHKITIKRFSQLVDVYGGNSKKWPLEERDAALHLLEKSVEASHLQQSNSNLDYLLDKVPIISPTSMLRQRILASTQIYVEPVRDTWQWFVALLIGNTMRGHLLRPTFALIIPLLFGLFVGFNLANLNNEADITNETVWVEEEVNLLALGSME